MLYTSRVASMVPLKGLPWDDLNPGGGEGGGNQQGF